MRGHCGAGTEVRGVVTETGRGEELGRPGRVPRGVVVHPRVRDDLHRGKGTNACRRHPRSPSRRPLSLGHRSRASRCRRRRSIRPSPRPDRRSTRTMATPSAEPPRVGLTTKGRPIRVDQGVEHRTGAEVAEGRVGKGDGRGGVHVLAGDVRLGDHLVEGQSAGIRAGPHVRDAQAVQDVAQRAVLTAGPVQQRDHAVRGGGREVPEKGGVEVVDGHALAHGSQGLGHAPTGADGDVALMREPACQDDDRSGHCPTPCPRPNRVRVWS